MINPLYALSGFVVGVLVGLTGVGGGSLMTPLLVLVFGLHPSTAVGTDLLYAAATKSVGTVVHGFTGTIDWRIVLRLATGSVPATAVTLIVLSHLGKAIDTQHGLLNTVLGGALILSALSILLRKVIHDFFLRRAKPLDPGRTTAFTVLLGAVLGVLVSLSSVGAGAIGLTVLLVLYPTMQASKPSATSPTPCPDFPGGPGTLGGQHREFRPAGLLLTGRSQALSSAACWPRAPPTACCDPRLDPGPRRQQDVLLGKMKGSHRDTEDTEALVLRQVCNDMK
jgi:uncharacterized membrane protein YfcA